MNSQINYTEVPGGPAVTPNEPLVVKLSNIHDNLLETMDTLMAMHGKMFGSEMKNDEPNTANSVEEALDADCRISRLVLDLAREIKSRIGV